MFCLLKALMLGWNLIGWQCLFVFYHSSAGIHFKRDSNNIMPVLPSLYCSYWIELPTRIELERFFKLYSLVINFMRLTTCINELWTRTWQPTPRIIVNHVLIDRYPFHDVEILINILFLIFLCIHNSIYAVSQPLLSSQPICACSITLIKSLSNSHSFTLLVGFRCSSLLSLVPLSIILVVSLIL